MFTVYAVLRGGDEGAEKVEAGPGLVTEEGEVASGVGTGGDDGDGDGADGGDGEREARNVG